MLVRSVQPVSRCGNQAKGWDGRIRKDGIARQDSTTTGRKVVATGGMKRGELLMRRGDGFEKCEQVVVDDDDDVGDDWEVKKTRRKSVPMQIPKVVSLRMIHSRISLVCYCCCSSMMNMAYVFVCFFPLLYNNVNSSPLCASFNGI